MNALQRLAALLALVGASAALAADPPRTLAIAPASLMAARLALAERPARLEAPLAQLRAEADQLLKARPASVLDKTGAAASGDPHDYFSFAPYWWPDPRKPGGLPYIRDDGKLNPASKHGTDSAAFSRTCTAVETLGLAYWFTGDERYAQKAAILTRNWFLDPATRMNPNLAHAQAIPGVNSGRGIGIIESRHLIKLQDGIALLATSPAWTAADGAGMTAWLGDYYRWLTSSRHGRDEAAADNNHGSWYDAQVVALALGMGHVDEAQALLRTVASRRIRRQIEPDGRQPLELARTKSLSYSIFNAEALMLLARFGEQAGIDVWGYASADGRSLPAAIGHLAAYADPTKPWPQADLEPGERGRILPLLAQALRFGEDPRFGAPLAAAGSAAAGAARWQLFALGQR